jgi:Na+-driven multidrug efflux pump
MLQFVIGGIFGLGWGPIARGGMAGVAIGFVAANCLGLIVFLALLMSGRLRVRLSLAAIKLRWEMFVDILKVGGFSLLGPTQSMATILILTALMSRQSTEVLAGFAIGSRMEFLLIPITFAIGVACVPMVGMAIGAGNVARARKVAWIGAAVAATVLGVLGLVVAFTAEYIAGFFSTDPEVLAAAHLFFVWAGPCYAMFGLAHCLYFAAQGSGKMLGPILAGTVRLSVVAFGGLVAARAAGAGVGVFCAAQRVNGGLRYCGGDRDAAHLVVTLMLASKCQRQAVGDRQHRQLDACINM